MVSQNNKLILQTKNRFLCYENITLTKNCEWFPLNNHINIGLVFYESWLVKYLFKSIKYTFRDPVTQCKRDCLKTTLMILT